jgi:ABC-type lipoprotein release transport system permease subunit
MTPGALLRLTRVTLRRERKNALLSAFGVAVGVGALVFFLGLGLGVGKVVRERIFPVDANLIEVVPPPVSLGGLLGGGELDADVVARLSAIEGVTRVYKKMDVRVPAATRYDGQFFGSHVRMGLEVVAVGVEPALVQKDVVTGTFEDPGPGKPIPGIANTRLLEIYNKTFAPARHLPQLSAGLLAGFTFPVEFNRSFIAATRPGPVIPTQVQIAGLSERAPLAGIAIPLKAAIRLNQQAGVDATRFSALTLAAEDPAEVPAITAQVKEMGLAIDDTERTLSENVGLAVMLTTSALALLSVLICVLAAVNIAHALFASVRARAKEIGVMRAVGATRSDVRRWILAEASAIGLFGGVVGTAGALLAAAAVNALSTKLLPAFPFKPDSFFHFPWPVWVGGIALGWAASFLGAILPSLTAAATDPARTLAG